MPGRLWNAWATAPPVSPEVAARMVSGAASLSRSADIMRAMKRAPMSLKACVGPWKSSSMWMPGSTSRRGTGKSSAPCTAWRRMLSATSRPSRWRATTKARSGNVRSARAARSSSGRGGTEAGTKSPPSGAWPRKRASGKVQVGPGVRRAGVPRVLISCIGWRGGARRSGEGAGFGRSCLCGTYATVGCNIWVGRHPPA